MTIHTKEYMEEYARLSLSEILGFNIDTLVHCDSPDIQDFENRIGIEVVEDVYECEKELERFWEKYSNTSVNLIPKKKIDGYYSKKGTLKIEHNQLKGGSLGEEKPNSPKHLISTIRKKISKLNSGNYVTFSTYMLYVFVETVSLYDSYVYSIIDEVNKIDVPIKYNKLILDGYFEICYCDMTTRSFSRHFIPKNTRELLSRKTADIISTYSI